MAPAQAWSDNDDKRLLFSILATHNLKLDYHAIATDMGDGRTGNAVSKRLKRIKDTFKNAPAASASDITSDGIKTKDGNSASPDPQTPSPTPTPTKKPRTPKRKKGQANGANDDHVDGDVDGDGAVNGASTSPTPTPTKKPRAKSGPKPKAKATSSITPAISVVKEEDNEQERMETDN
ncbi:MAG: hypothetical protein Q9160_008932 [Pyrenula sp. 1 TL-2023]